MKILSFEEIRKLNIAPETVLQWVQEALLQKEEALLPAKISMKPQEGVFCNVMPAFVGGFSGVKVVTRYPGREPSLDSQLLLLDAQTGKTLCLMDANWITTMRTGAVAAHSIGLLAKKDFSRISMIGLGNTAAAAFQMLLALCPQRRLTVRLYRYKDQHEIFMRRFSDCPNVTFEVADTYEQMVRGADVVVSAVTYCAQDICRDEWFDKGVLVVPIHTRGFTNCDLFFDRVFADDTAHVCHFKNFERFRDYAQVSDVLLGRHAGRGSGEERILAYNIGIALHDVYIASKIYQMAQDSAGQADLKPPTERLWV